MTLSRRTQAIAGGVLLVGLLVWAARVDVPWLSGRIKGDEATYIALAFSLAKDGDLKYRPEDLRRFRSLYAESGRGPDGIFLKASYRLGVHLRAGWPPVEITKTPVPTTEQLEYAKPFIYSIVAAPFAALFGLGGFLLLNILLLATCIAAGAAFATARLGRVAGVITGAGFVLASVAPLYGAWMTPEIFNFTLVFVAYFLWLYKEVAPPAASPVWRAPSLEWIAALLIGIAAYSKISHLLLVGPIVVSAVARQRWKHAVALGALFTLGLAGLFGIHAWVTGEANFQGGERNTYQEHYPFDGTTTFESGNRMATDEANDENILAPDFLFPTLRLNSWYFIVGRDAGFIPYFFPGVLIVLWWLIRWRQWTLWQVTTLLAVIGSALGLLALTPGSWNGGGGPIGNRYFLSIYPAVLFLLPAGFPTAAATVSFAVGLTFLGPILVHPFASSQNTWLSVQRWPLRLLPVELTLAAQSLPVALQQDRQRIKVNDDPLVFLYYLDDKTYFQEKDGFWVAPGTTDIVVRTEYPLTSIELGISSNVANQVDVSIGGRSRRVVLAAGEEQRLRLSPDRGVHAFQSYQVLLTITTARGFYPRDTNPNATDTRHLGAFIRPQYKVDTTAPR